MKHWVLTALLGGLSGFLVHYATSLPDDTKIITVPQMICDYDEVQLWTYVDNDDSPDTQCMDGDEFYNWWRTHVVNPRSNREPDSTHATEQQEQR